VHLIGAAGAGRAAQTRARHQYIVAGDSVAFVMPPDRGGGGGVNQMGLPGANLPARC
jgi:hypothetical protein